MNLADFQNLPLHGGFLLLRVTVSDVPMVDAMGRLALAKTHIVGSTLEIELGCSMPDPDEISISLYHEVLEAAAVAAPSPPSSVWELNEAGFESAACDYHQRLGFATPDTLNQMLAEFGF
jgi:hypothetical protein